MTNWWYLALSGLEQTGSDRAIMFEGRNAVCMELGVQHCQQNDQPV